MKKAKIKTSDNRPARQPFAKSHKGLARRIERKQARQAKTYHALQSA